MKMAQDGSDFCMPNQKDTQDLLTGDVKIDLESKVKVKQKVIKSHKFSKCHNFQTIQDRHMVCM